MGHVAMAEGSLPTGTVTYLMSDVERSTWLWERYPDEMRSALERHDSLIESLVAQHSGTVVRPLLGITNSAMR